MPGEPWKHLDAHFRLRLAQMPWDVFERFFLDLFNSGVSVTISRDGSSIKKRIISAEIWGGRGRSQDGIDLRLEVEGREVWAMQCKKVQSWNLSQTKRAIERAEEFAANHYFLAVACDTGTEVQAEIKSHAQWTLWNLETICSEFRLIVPAPKRRDILTFLDKDEVKRFVPFWTSTLVTPEAFFERYTGADKPLRHDWPLVGREEELKRLIDWANGPQKIFLLSARGGEGKTRLIREFSEEMKRTDPEAEVLFLNPFREDSDFSLGGSGDAARQFVVVDDAHRIDLVPQPLLDQVRMNDQAKIVLLTRPQGRESIVSKLIETGFKESVVSFLTLSSLKGAAAARLATIVLGESFKERLTEFLRLTENNPFLITTAGSLLLNGRLVWGSWNSHEGFRRRVFEEFETENLASIPEPERVQTSRLLRLLAILSPVAYTTAFVERAELLLPGAISIERLINFLRLVELVVGSDQGLRVSPDLFADFLVYETCFDPKNRETVWTERVLHAFVDHGAVLIRNISEARWIAELNGVSDDKVLEPLMKWQREQFLKQSFAERSATLRYWSSFCQYLPKETLEMARLALEAKTAPAYESLAGRMGSIDTYEYVTKQLPALLRPVAKYHLDYSHEALDILWELGRAETRPEHNNQNHPWTVIADVFKYEPSKPLNYNDSALDWLEKLLRQPATLNELEQPTPVLRLFLGPCFARIQDGSYIDGRTIHFVEQHVSLKATQRVRDRAMRIIDGIIEGGPALAVLDALSALEIAIQRAGLSSTRGITDVEKFRAYWRPERLKALARYREVLVKYPDVVLQYEIRRTLKRDVIYEEDVEFAAECRKILELLPKNFRLRTAVALTPDFAFEFEEDFQDKSDPNRFSQSRERWTQEVKNVAEAIAEKYPNGKDLYAFLASIAAELTAGGFSLNQYLLLSALGETNPPLACAVANEILAAEKKTTLLQNWTALIDNSHVSPQEKTQLFERAIRENVDGASVAVVRHLAGEAQGKQLLDQRSRDVLFDVARRAGELEAIYLCQLVEHASEPNLPWAFELLWVLTEKPIAASFFGACLTALVPFQDRTKPTPPEIVRHVFKQLIQVPDLGFYQHGHAWEKLKKFYPHDVYELLAARIAYAGSTDDWDYTPIPHDMEGRLSLPELMKDPRIDAIVADLWERAENFPDESRWMWIKLFQAVVIEEQQFWYERFRREVAKAALGDELLRLIQLISFEGSLIVFRFPEITEDLLQRAAVLGGEELLKSVRSKLHRGSGPGVRGYTNGQLDAEYDYLEAAALKAAEKHADNPVLGPFYRWIVEVEQKDRLFNKLRADEDMAG